MRRYGYVAGAPLAVLLTALTFLLVIARTGEVPGLVHPWPLLLALGASAAAWWLQGVIVAALARPLVESVRVADTFRTYMAGTFVAGVSPVKGAEIPYEVYLLGRLGLSAGEGSTVVGTRVLLDAAILTPAALFALALAPALPEVEAPKLVLSLLAVAGISAAVAFLVGGRGGRLICRPRRDEPGWLAKGRERVRDFCGAVRASAASYRCRGHLKALAQAAALTVVYWVFRLTAGPLALMAVGWSGDWTPVIFAQLILVSFVIPLAPTPGGSGARELGLAALLSAYVPAVQLSSGIVVYTGLTYCLPVAVGAFFALRQLWDITHRGEGRKAADGESCTAAPARRRTRAVL